MAYIHNQDAEVMERILNGAVPDELIEEVSIRTKLYHSMGASGAIGPAMLIDAMRKCGLGQILDKTPTDYVDWSRVPMQTQVEVSEDPLRLQPRVWKRAKYRGIIGQGVLCVQIDGDNTLQEFYMRNVRLGWSDETAPKQEDLKAIDHGEESDELQNQEDPEPVVYNLDLDWDKLPKGSPVVIEETLGSRMEGEFIGTETDAQGVLVVVKLKNERRHRRFAEGLVTVVSAAATA